MTEEERTAKCIHCGYWKINCKLVKYEFAGKRYKGKHWVCKDCRS